MGRARVSSVDVALRRGVGTITLRLIDGRLDERAHAALVDACAALDLEDDLRVVVLRSRGKAFCVGDADDVTIDGADGIDAVGRLRVPVLAVLGGDALDAGLELALACDLRVAARSARLGWPGASDPIAPRHGATQRLPRIVGGPTAARMLYLRETWTAGAGKEAGLLHSVVKREDLAAHVRTLVTTLAARAPVAQRYAKETLRAASDLPLSEGLRLEGDLYVLLQTTRDRSEGVASFHERRRPRFTGR